MIHDVFIQGSLPLCVLFWNNQQKSWSTFNMNLSVQIFRLLLNFGYTCHSSGTNLSWPALEVSWREFTEALIGTKSPLLSMETDIWRFYVVVKLADRWVAVKARAPSISRVLPPPQPWERIRTEVWSGPSHSSGPGCVPEWLRCRSLCNPWPFGSRPCRSKHTSLFGRPHHCSV